MQNAVREYLLSVHLPEFVNGLKARDLFRLLTKTIGQEIQVPGGSNKKAKEFISKLNKELGTPPISKYQMQMAFARLCASDFIDPDYDESDIFFARSKNFYRSQKWRNLRYLALEKAEGRCQACGVSAKDGVVLHVDHIYPRSIYPNLALQPFNLQVLCEDCNHGKGNMHIHDFR